MTMTAIWMLAIATGGAGINLRVRSMALLALINGLAAVGFALLYIGVGI